MTPIISIVGRRKSGKTTVLGRLIAELTRRGLRVGVLKHSPHGFAMDREGTDTWHHRRAGAWAVGILSANELAVIRSHSREAPPPLEQAAQALGADFDLVLTEGFKQAPTRKIEVVRAQTGCEIMTPPEWLLAVVADCPVETAAPRFGFEETARLADLVVEAARGLPAGEI